MKNILTNTILLALILFCACQTNDKSKEKKPDNKEQLPNRDTDFSIVGVPWPADSGRIPINVIHDSLSQHKQVMKGTVSRGTYITDTLGIKKQFIYVVYTPDSAQGCTDYGFYSWVKPSLEIDAGTGTFQPVPDKVADKALDSKAATGQGFTFGGWNPDYQVKWVDSTNKARQKAKQSPFPKLHPRDSLQNGQPYMPFPTPDGKGFLDCPSLTTRGKNGELSPGERIVVDLVKAPEKGVGAKAPGPYTYRLKYIVKGETYLFCLRQQQCLGYFTWTSTEIMTIKIVYVEDTKAPPSVDLGKKNWKRGTEFTSVSSLTMGPWQSCYGL